MAIDVGRIPAFDKQPKVVGLGLALPFGNGAVLDQMVYLP